MLGYSPALSTEFLQHQFIRRISFIFGSNVILTLARRANQGNFDSLRLFSHIFLSPEAGSNRRPPSYQDGALPTELSGQNCLNFTLSKLFLQLSVIMQFLTLAKRLALDFPS